MENHKWKIAEGDTMIKQIIYYLQMVKIEHTLFALPFAVIGMLSAQRGWPAPNVILWIILAFTSARAAAMTFNRIIDLKYDAINPRTKNRHIPRGLISKKSAYIFLFISIAVFEVTCYELNMLALLLSPAALFIIFFYSYTKRFTHYSHFILGLALAAAPVGAGIAVTGHFYPPLFILALCVVFWVAGFDILYSTQDYDFDKEHGLHSFCVKFGIKNSLDIAFVCHIISLLTFWLFTRAVYAGPAFSMGTAFAAIFFLYERIIVKPDDLSRVPEAFFIINGLVSVILMGFMILDIHIFKF